MEDKEETQEDVVIPGTEEGTSEEEEVVSKKSTSFFALTEEEKREMYEKTGQAVIMCPNGLCATESVLEAVEDPTNIVDYRSQCRLHQFEM